MAILKTKIEIHVLNVNKKKVQEAFLQINFFKKNQEKSNGTNTQSRKCSYVRGG